MATTIVSGSKDRQIPGIDGGTFRASAAPVDAVLIKTKFKYIHTLLVMGLASSGAAVSDVVYNISQTSGGAVIASGDLAAGREYAWIAWGVGG